MNNPALRHTAPGLLGFARNDGVVPRKPLPEAAAASPASVVLLDIAHLVAIEPACAVHVVLIVPHDEIIRLPAMTMRRTGVASHAR